MQTFIDHLEQNWLNYLIFAVRPLITIILWYIVDRLLKALHKRDNFINKRVERIMSKASDDVRRHVIEQRSRTFRGILFQTLRILVGSFFIFTLLDNINIDPKPLLAGIGVVGLGMTLAAQNILRDFINGVLIVIEDQFNVGDWIAVNGVSGTVESFTMRATRLRATNGDLITIPNGSISQVQNSTKNYSVAVVDVGVAYDSDMSKVFCVMQRCGEEIKKMKAGVVTKDPNVQGIMQFRDSDLLMRITARTLPGEQWGVERTLRRIIKDHFDEENIEIPFPQMVNRNISEGTSAPPVNLGTPPQTPAGS